MPKPGLFITGTDTEMGKTVVASAIAVVLRRRHVAVGVCKPIASGCRHERERLVSPDAEALAHFADCRATLDMINPVRYRAPLAPAVAAERTERPVDHSAIADSLRRLDADHDVMLIEGIGGLMVPIDAKQTVLDLAKWLGYPVLVVTRADLGTLNHTAMTCSLIRSAKLRLAGLVINQYNPDTPDLAESTNPLWLARQNDTTVLATVPRTTGVAVEKGRLPDEVIDAVAVADWQQILQPPKAPQWVGA